MCCWSEGSSSNSLKPVLMPGCLALTNGSLLMVAFHQHASGMSCAKSVSQVGLCSFKRILAAVFQIAIILGSGSGGARCTARRQYVCNIRVEQRHRTTQRATTANCVIQTHQLVANQRHHSVHLFGIKYCENTRLGQHLEAAQRLLADLCKL
eukprot:1139203-Pelagomonas_calceolata.AAC.3